jgi:hypothetical protein
MMRFFHVTPPSVHQMILTLERRRLISRVPGQARSIMLRLPAEELPPLQGTMVAATIHAPPPKTDCHQATDTETALLRFGKIQLEQLFSYNRQTPLDDSEFVPLLDMLIDTFAHAGLSAAPVAAVHFLVETAGVDPRRIGAVGYGEYRPIADNSTPEGRAKNRRIAITILPDELAGADTVPTIITNAPIDPQPPPAASVAPEPAAK